MAVEIYLRKLYDTLVPCDQAQAEVLERLKPNAEYKAVFTQPRNPGFHRKAFALAQIAFDAWEPPKDKEYNGKPIMKEFEAFREELTVLAGFYDVTWTLAGKMKLRAHSWAWGAADQLKFEEMYQGFITVILRDILTGYTKDDLDATVDKILRFA